MNIGKHKAYKLLLITLLILFHFLTNGQEVKVLDSTYSEGAQGYGEFMRKNLRYPIESKRNANEGLLIYEVTVTNLGEVSVRFMTKVDEAIEKMVTPLIQATSDKWLKKNVPYKIYQPVSFNLGYPYSQDLIGKVPGLSGKSEFPLLNEIVITGISRISSSNGISSSAHKTKEGVKLKTYNKLVRSLEKHLSKGKVQKAYKTISSIIRYNPFDKSLIQQRRRLEKQLGKDEYRAYDILWLQAMDYIASVQSKKP